MSIAALTTLMPEYWSLVRKLKNVRKRNVCFVPLEYQESSTPQHSETLRKTLPYSILPVLTKMPILCHLPPLQLFLAPCVLQVWRIKDNERERPILIWHFREVGQHVWTHTKLSAVTQFRFYLSYILKQYSRIILVEIKHLTPAAGVQNLFCIICYHFH